MWGSGPPSSRLWLMGEGPHTEELRKGVPFIGPAGQVARFGVKAAGLDWDTIRVINTVACSAQWRGKPRPPSPAEAAHCMEAHGWPHLRRHNPFVVVAFGEVAHRALLNKWNHRVSMKEWRGSVVEVGGEGETRRNRRRFRIQEIVGVPQGRGPQGG